MYIIVKQVAEKWGLLYPLPYFTSRKRTQTYRGVGATTRTLFTGT